MVEYRVYTLGDDGHIVKSTPLICDDDSQALELARVMSEGHMLEIWNGEHLVARLGKDR
jgi:hypothetical protein